MNKRVKIVATLGPAVEIRGGKKFGEDGYWSEKLDPDASAKNIAQLIKEGANVPVYVLEFLLGQYCSSDDEEIIEQGVQNVKHILADNFVRPDEAQKILSQLRKKGSHTVIDMITVNLDIKKNCFFASFSNLGLDKVPIAD